MVMSNRISIVNTSLRQPTVIRPRLKWLGEDTVRFGHAPQPEPPPGDDKNPKKSNKWPFLYSFIEGSVVISALYGIMELTERNPEYFSDRPGLKLLISGGLFALHQLSHLGLFAYGYRVGKRAEKGKDIPPQPPASATPPTDEKKD